MSDYYARPEDEPAAREREAMGAVTTPPYPGGTGSAPYGRRRLAGMPMTRRPIETKPFFLTSEFLLALLTQLAIGLTAAITDAVNAWHGILLVTAVTGAYMLSRGIAKAGTRTMAIDPREHLDLMPPRHPGDSGREP